MTKTINVYYARGKTYVALAEHLFLTVSDDGESRSFVESIPAEHIESSERSDNHGQTGSQARKMIATACDVARAIREAEALLGKTEKSA